MHSRSWCLIGGRNPPGPLIGRVLANGHRLSRVAHTANSRWCPTILPQKGVSVTGSNGVTADFIEMEHAAQGKWAQRDERYDSSLAQSDENSSAK